MRAVLSWIVDVPDDVPDEDFRAAVEASRLAFAFAGMHARLARVERREHDAGPRPPAVNAPGEPKGAPS